MKTCIVVCLFAVLAVALARPDEHYTDKYDNTNLDEILGTKRLLVGYIKCILDEGKCTPEGKELKSHIQESLQNNCGKCTDKQKVESRRVMGYLINHEPTYWERLTAKFDPENKYSEIYEKELREVKTQA